MLGSVVCCWRSGRVPARRLHWSWTRRKPPCWIACPGSSLRPSLPGLGCLRKIGASSLARWPLSCWPLWRRGFRLRKKADRRRVDRPRVSGQTAWKNQSEATVPASSSSGAKNRARHHPRQSEHALHALRRGDRARAPRAARAAVSDPGPGGRRFRRGFPRLSAVRRPTIPSTWTTLPGLH